MAKNKMGLTAIAFLSYMVMSGLLTQAGVILNTLAQQLALPASEAVTVFSWLTGGALIGTFISMYLYTKFAVRPLLLVAYSILLVVLAVLQVAPSSEYWIIATAFLILGICCGCGLSGGAVIISRLYHAQRRASAFIATDCTFSAAGYIFPSLAGWLLAQHVDWRLSYLAVGGLALIILLLAAFTKAPNHEKPPATSTKPISSPLSEFKSIATPRVLCFALGVCLYLVAQTTFLTWAPNYLMAQFNSTQEVASQIVGNYWGFSIFGLLLSVVLVNVIPTRLMLLTVAAIAVTFSFVFLLVSSEVVFLSCGLAFGLTTTSIYKVAISVGSHQVPNSPPMLVTLMLFSGSIGSTLAPTVSGYVVGLTSEKGALQFSLASFLLMFCLFSIALYLEQRELKLPKRSP